jgi:hypothetical protein
VAAAAQKLALRVDPRHWLVGVGGAIAVLCGMGILRFAHKDALRLFNLDGERNVPATFSALLWVCVAVLAFLVGNAQPHRQGRAWKLLSVPFFLLALDEFGEVHEHLQYYAGVDWQILYAPVALVGAVLWFVIARRLRALGTGFWAFVWATACIVAAQPLEALEIDSHANPRPGFRVMVVSEETLEMLAALLLGFAFLQALRALAPEARRASA